MFKKIALLTAFAFALTLGAFASPTTAHAAGLLPNDSGNTVQAPATADDANDRIDHSEGTTLALSDDIGEMADRIGEMSDRILWTETQIGDMADRIVESEHLISDSSLGLAGMGQDSTNTISSPLP